MTDTESFPHFWSRRVAAALLSLLCAAALVGCAEDNSEPKAPTAAERLAEVQAVLDQRDKAVRERDRAGFMQTVDRADKRLVQRQRRWFDNVTQLPWREFRMRATTQQWPQMLRDPAWGAEVLVPKVEQIQQLAGYDSAPVRRTTGLALAHRAGTLKVVGDRTRTGNVFPEYQPAPWDLTRIWVRHRNNVLGLFDKETEPQARTLMDTVRRGVADVSNGLPFTWDRRVVVYAFEQKAILNSFHNVPGGKIQHLGAMTFPIHAEQTRSRVVGLRFTILPSSITAGEPFLGRIVRHELTHVAVGKRDDGVPLWLSEGMAEYLGAREIPKAQRRIAAVAVDRARTEETPRLPPSANFNGPEQDWHYALSWMACDHIAETAGEARLWELMTAMSNHGQGTTDSRQDEVLRRVLGYDGNELADRAAARIRDIYR